MSLFHAVSLLIALVALFGYVNRRVLRLPDVIGMTAIGLIVSIAVAAYGQIDPAVEEWARRGVEGIHFPNLILHGVLGMLLFAGSLHVNFSDIAREKYAILALATIGVGLSTVIVGTLFYYATAALDVAMPHTVCLLFGALISPTDPVAVLGILRRVGVPKALETRITGESLFNDGTAVALFLVLLALVTGSSEQSAAGAARLIATEVLGGFAFGLAFGFAGFYLLRGLDSYVLEIMITLALATAGYAIAERFHASAPIAVVVMGLVVGNHGRRFAMSGETRRYLFGFWQVVDELLNLLLFGLIGLEVVALSLSATDLWLGLIAIPVVLAARLASVSLPMLVLSRFRTFGRHSITMMTWGGLRGAISVALALSLPDLPARGRIVAATYVVVIFSILVQALTVGHLAERLGLRQTRPRKESAPPD